MNNCCIIELSVHKWANAFMFPIFCTVAWYSKGKLSVMGGKEGALSKIGQKEGQIRGGEWAVRGARGEFMATFLCAS